MSIMNKWSNIDNYSRNISEAEKNSIFHNGTVEWDPMIKELSKRTHLPKFICEMVYAAEGKILEDIGLMH